MNPKKPETGYDVMPEPQNGLSVSGVVEAILEVGRHRQATLLKLRAALECGDTENALNCARQFNFKGCHGTAKHWKVREAREKSTRGTEI